MKHVLLAALLLGFLTARAQHDPTAYLRPLANTTDLTATDVANYIVTDQYRDARMGVTHIYLQQTHAGVPVFNGTLSLHVADDGRLVRLNNRFVPDLAVKAPAAQASLTAEQVVQAAGAHVDYVPKWLVPLSKDSSAAQRTVFGHVGDEHVEAKLYYLADSDGAVRLVWNVVLPTPEHDHWWNVRVDANTGEVIEQNDWVVHCAPAFSGRSVAESPIGRVSAPSRPAPLGPTETAQTQTDGGTYRVFAYPLESPLYGPRTLVSSPADPVAAPFGWHDTNGALGAEFTNTRGNFVWVQEDLDNNNNTFGEGAEGGDSLVFDFEFNEDTTAAGLLPAAMTNLFYWNNLIHDVLYHYGFDEVSGNFQENNYGNGGNGSDFVVVDAQDGGGLNNANFGTPPDGSNPRMQVYLWQQGGSDFLTVHTPPGLAGTYSASTSSFGPTPGAPITAALALVNDGTSAPTLGCNPLVNPAEVAGKIAVVDRGNCFFYSKVNNAQAAGALAVIVVNNVPGAPFTMGGTPSVPPNIPAIMVSQTLGNALKNAIPNGVTATIAAADVPFFDCAFDNGVVAHEYGHGVSNRLTGGPSAANCLWNDEQMGEGWSDFFTLVLSHQPGDGPNDARGIGNYVTGNSTTGPGIRPYRYTPDMSVNPFTYQNIANVSIPHGVGSVWCTMLWDLYWRLTEIYGYDPDIIGGTGGNNMAIQLVMDGMKLQACRPGFVDGRDAILLADSLLNGGTNKCVIWEVFARRGLGYSASQGSSDVVGDETQAFDLPPSCAEVTAFVSDDPLLCPGESVTFTSTFAGGATAWEWSFPGGTPATASGPNPTVAYEAAGAYDVTLVVSNQAGADTFAVAEFVRVSDLTGATATQTGAGTAAITPEGGLAPYTYLWSDAAQQTTDTATGLAPGFYTVMVTDAAGCTAVTSVTVEEVTSLRSATSGPRLTVAPNPTAGRVSLRLSAPPARPWRVAVYNQLGQWVLDWELPARPADSRYDLDVRHLPAGVYLLRAGNADFQSTERLLIR